MLPASYYEGKVSDKRLTRAIKDMAREPHKIRVDTWLGGYRGLYPDGRNDETAYHQRSTLMPFRVTYGGRTMASITAIEAQAWALKRPAQVKLLRRAWDFAVQMQVAPLNVWAFVVMPKRDRPRRRPPTDEELRLALDRCVERGWPTLRRMVVIAAHSGARRGGLLRLRRCDVDLDARRMTVTEKGDKKRTVLLCGDSHAAMAAQFEMRQQHVWQPRKGGLSPLVFVNSEYDHRPLHPDTLQERWQAVRGDFPHGFHSLRHYAATWLASQGVAPLDIAVQLGHMDSEGRPYEQLIRRVYDHPDPEHALERIAALAARPTERQGS